MIRVVFQVLISGCLHELKLVFASVVILITDIFGSFTLLRACVNNFTNLMNILSTEELRQAEQSLSKIAIKPNCKLKLPTQRQCLVMGSFQGSAFPVASPPAQGAVRKMMSLAENMRSLKQSQPQAIFHMLTLTLMSMLYRDNLRCSGESWGSKQAKDGNSFLLETIKCCLYSRDLEFKRLKNVGFPFETQQLKLLVHQFFSFMQSPPLSKANRLAVAEWILQQNPLLLSTFTLFLRLILATVGVQEVQDCRKCVNSEQAIMNLLQFFDLHYRSLGQLVLFFEDGLFLSIVQGEIVLGQYYENQSQKYNQKQLIAKKSQAQAKVTSSFQPSPSQKGLLTDTHKKGIVENDLRLFNLLLESSEDEDEHFSAHKQKENESETPHFKDNTDNFHFLRKKKSTQLKPDEASYQLSRLIMDESHEFSQDEVAPTPYLGGEIQSNFPTSFASKQLPTPQHLDSPIDQLNCISNSSLLSQKEMNKSFFQQSIGALTHEGRKESQFGYNSAYSSSKRKQMASSAFTEIENINSKKDFVQQSWEEICNCYCRKARLKRNAVISKVVEVKLAPAPELEKTLYSLTSSKRLLTYKPTFERRGKDSEHLLNQKPQNVKYDNNLQNRKPTFLLNFNKNKASQQSFSKSLVNQPKNHQQSFYNQPSPQGSRVAKMKFFAQDTQAAGGNQSRSMPKQYQSKRTKKSELDIKQRENQKMVSSGNQQLGITKNWQSNSTCVQNIAGYTRIIKTNQTQLCSTSALSCASLKSFPAVQLSASTFSSSPNATYLNKGILSLDDANKYNSSNPEFRHYYQQSVQREFKVTTVQPSVKSQEQTNKNSFS